MKKLWLSIPRPIRVLVNILAICVVAVTFYVCIGAPTVSKEQAFRREERANLLGPSTILFSDRVDNYPYGHLILAETDNCVITWVDDSWYGFNYHEKTGDLTLVTAPKYWFDFGTETWEINLPVFLVDNYPEAVYADVQLEIQGIYVHNLNGKRLEEPLDHQFNLRARREKDGFFCFSLVLPYVDEFDKHGNSTWNTHGADGFALDALSQTFTNARMISRPQSDVTITATVRLHDDGYNLITERELVFSTISD